jgi:hypothetical protein
VRGATCKQSALAYSLSMGARMTPASHRLRRAIIERRSDAPRWLQLAAPPQSPGSPAALGDRQERTQRQARRIALSMALDRAEQRPEPVRLVGWLYPITRNPATLDPATHSGVCSPCILQQGGREGNDK